MTKLIDQLNGHHIKEAESILRHKDLVLNGTIIAIDPSSKSVGVAISQNGEFVESHRIKADDGEKIGVRLNQILERLPNVDKVDGVILEKVRSSTGHVYLVWSNGAVLAKYAPEFVTEVSTKAWWKVRGPNYVKSDIADAECVLEFALRLCEEDE